MTKTLVCLPTYNEQQSVGLMIDQISALGFDVIVSDAGSTDGTVEIAKDKGAEVIFREKPGKGSGVQSALRYADKNGYEALVFIDCDETYPVHDIPKLVELAPDYDMVVGARKMEHIDPPRRLANYFFTGVVNLLYGADFKDINSGLRLLRVSSYLPLIDADKFDVESQITCRTKRKGLKYKEILVDYADRQGDSKVGLPDAVDTLWRIIKERF